MVSKNIENKKLAKIATIYTTDDIQKVYKQFANHANSVVYSKDGGWS